MSHRVVVTGLGGLSPLGNTVDALWDGLMAARSGIDVVSLFDHADLPVTIAGEVRGFDADARWGSRDARKLDRFLQFAVAASEDALADAGLVIDEDNAEDVAVYIGSGVGGLDTVCDAQTTLLQGGPRKLSPFVIPKMLINMASGQVSIATGARGPNFSHVSACASGNHSIGEAFRLLRAGEATAAICGGAEAAITPIGLAGFARMKALSTRNDDPKRASRPFAAGRDGFVMGEGAGVLVLETLEAARARGARIYAEVCGYGATADAYHMTAPHPDGRGAIACMRRALRSAGWSAEDVDYINAHGTSTPFNDAMETKAVHAVFADHAARLAVSSTKSMTGHLLGAAGGLEAVIACLAIARGAVPPTINLDEPDPDCDLDYVAGQARAMSVRRVLSNAFGFGGTNATLAFGPPPA